MSTCTTAADVLASSPHRSLSSSCVKTLESLTHLFFQLEWWRPEGSLFHRALETRNNKLKLSSRIPWQINVNTGQQLCLVLVPKFRGLQLHTQDCWRSTTVIVRRQFVGHALNVDSWHKNAQAQSMSDCRPCTQGLITCCPEKWERPLLMSLFSVSSAALMGFAGTQVAGNSISCSSFVYWILNNDSSWFPFEFQEG